MLNILSCQLRVSSTRTITTGLLSRSTILSHFPPRKAFQISTIKRFNTNIARNHDPVELNEEDVEECRHWLSQFDAKTFPRSLGELSYSRSSGPGGQNVNKYVVILGFPPLCSVKASCSTT